MVLVHGSRSIYMGRGVVNLRDLGEDVMSVHLWEENKGWVLGRTPDINPPACTTFWKVRHLSPALL